MEIDDAVASTDVAMETDTADRETKAPAAKVKVQPGPGSASAASGLPQSAEELEALIALIHRNVSQNVLPRLHKCLTAKV